MTETNKKPSYEIKLSAVTKIYSQEEDCCGRTGHDMQDIEITANDGGGGTYYTIKTDRWAFSSVKELNDMVSEMIKDMKIEL